MNSSSPIFISKNLKLSSYKESIGVKIWTLAFINTWYSFDFDCHITFLQKSKWVRKL